MWVPVAALQIKKTSQQHDPGEEDQSTVWEGAVFKHKQA